MHCDLMVKGRLLTMDETRPVAAAMAVSGGRIVAVGDLADVEELRGPGTEVLDTGRRTVLPGFVEPHNHFFNDAVMLSGPLVDIRPVTLPTGDLVLARIEEEIARRGAAGAYFIGWDALLQPGLPAVTRDWLETRSPHPLVILHNSGHIVYFNDAARRLARLPDDIADPVGGHFGRTPDGRLDGRAFETPAVEMITYTLFEPVLSAGVVAAARSACGRAAAAGVTTTTELSFDGRTRDRLQAVIDAGALTTRLRLYETARSAAEGTVAPGTGDDLCRQIGVKVWADGSPWSGNIAASFPYLGSRICDLLGIEPGHRAAPNYEAEELRELVGQFVRDGWQLACHANGDVAADLALTAFEPLIADVTDHRTRLEHCSGMRADQFRRAHALGVTCSMFPGHVRYWGDQVEDAFGDEVAERWAPIADACASGMRVTLHNDSPVTPVSPIGNIATAVSRRTRSGRLLGPGQSIPLHTALRAHTVDAAWQVRAEDVVGSLTPGKYADFAVLDRDIEETAVEEIVETTVIATFLEGAVIHDRTA